MQDTVPLNRLQDALLLVVDDIETNRRLLSENLRARGYRNILTAADGAEALKLTLAHKPDIVILDLMMPGMDGFSYCEAIRQDAAFDDMPILVQTALDASEDKARAFSLGASDYICKPVEAEELMARLRVHLANRLQMEYLSAYRTRINAELDAARLMQERLMPEREQLQMCEFLYQLKIAASFETSSALGGDCWGMFPLTPTRLALYMYDFSGHGMTAALNVFRMHTLMQDFKSSAADPGSFLATLNRHLTPLLSASEFATMFYALIDTESDCLLYASAASPPPLLHTNGNVLALNGRGLPLGISANAVYETRYTPFQPNDLLLLYSDCLIETADSSGQYLTETTLKNTIRHTLAEPATNPGAHALNAVDALFHHHSSAPLTDDKTLCAYYRCAAR